jgi:hypothetical protein
MMLDEQEAYSPRLDVRKPSRGKGTSVLLTTRSVKVGKVISECREDNDDGAVQAGPLMAQRRCTEGQQVPAWRMEG